LTAILLRDEIRDTNARVTHTAFGVCGKQIGGGPRTV
jgi:hypothetical protein